MKVREIEISVISDIHLATHACKPKKVLRYLKSIHPKKLILNGDIIDSWRFSRNYFPKNHLKVIRQLIKMMEKGISIYYISGNHDEFLRKFNQPQIGNLKITNQIILDLDGTKTWIFHGDIFDNPIRQSKWIAKFGAAIYGLLTLFNKMLNQLLKISGKPEIIIYKNLKKRMVKNKSNLSKFEIAIGNAAVLQGFQTIICGHTHIPKEKELKIQDKILQYFNCGDWIEHFTATEYYDGKWHLYYHNEPDDETLPDEIDIPTEEIIYQTLVKELTFSNLLI